jgi:hypothetical protein
MTLAIRNGDTHGGEIEQYQPVSGGAMVPAQFGQQVSGFTQWINDARQLAPIAESLARTSFVPKPFQGKPAEVTAAILAGQEVGFSPMASLRSIDVIEGKPGMSAIALRALVQSHGHDIWVHESTATRAIVKGRRKGTDRVEASTWTIDRARQMGLTGKHNWKNQPQNMLLARATSEIARLIAADVILGMPYSTEELSDGVDSDTATAAAEMVPVSAALAAPKRTARRRPLEPMPSAEPEPEAPEPVQAELTVQPTETPAEPVDDGRMVTKKQQAHMFALWNDLGYSGDDNREQRLQITEKILGLDEPIESSNDLTAVEADQLIAALEARKNGGAS